jgi:prevent-host-death family protein
MKPLQIADDIVPLARFKVQASQLLRRLNQAQRPLVITQNGRPAGVLITPQEYDRLSEYDRFLEAVNRGLADSEAGRLIDDEALSAELDEPFSSSLKKSCCHPSNPSRLRYVSWRSVVAQCHDRVDP